MLEPPDGKPLEEPDNLGAPTEEYWAPGVRRRLNLNWRGAHGFESGRLVLLALLAAALVILALFLLGAIV
jgi:hypothetical protein